MSALAGFWRFDGRPDAAAACARMLNAQRLYGPHDSGVVGEIGGALALGRNLHRLTPEDAHDRQPLTGETVTLVADLRLDNRDELGAALGLGRRGELGDADIVLAALERWGEAGVERLHGDFALAAFDRARRRLILARSPSGLRPLLYHAAPGCFAFATMPKGLHALPEVPRAPDLEAIARGMTLLTSNGAETFFQRVRRVEPGAVVSVTPDGVRSRTWWTPSPALLRLKRDADYVEAFRAELDAAVGRCLRGVGRSVAAHLSSGLDSSAVATTAARLLGPAGGRVTAFTAVPRERYDLPQPPGAIGDEGPLAALTAAMHPNVDHVLVRTGGRSALTDLDRHVFLFDQPMPNPCNMAWVNAINDAARARGCQVLLTGELGNLSLSHDGLELLPQLLREGRWAALAGQWRALKRGGFLRYRASAARTFGPYLPPWLWSWASRNLRGQRVDALGYAAIRPDTLAALAAGARALSPGLDQRPPREGVKTRLWALARVDRGFMTKGVLAGWGLDRRDPTSDRRLIEFALSIPAEQVLRGGAPRALARAALADRVPRAVLWRRDRGRQAVDWHEGVENDLPLLRTEIDAIGANRAAAGLVDVPRLAALADDWPQGGWNRNDQILTYRYALLRGVSMGHFIRRASGGNA
jgi:asparagine synthase (glutamine-hydrolysing)